MNILKVQSGHCFNRVEQPGSRHPCPTLPPAPLHPGLLDDWSCPSSACPSSCVGCRQREACWQSEEQKLQIWRRRFGWSWSREGPVQAKRCWTAAAWALCCFSSGCPGGWASSGPALPAADCAAAGGGSAGRPPEAGETNKLSRNTDCKKNN